MKKIILTFCFGLFSLTCWGQGTFSLPDLPNKSFYELLNTIEEDPDGAEDVLVSLLFSLPVEYHQYVMPMVANMTSISEKTRMMPGIVEWRRKLPTRIAPELADYSKEHLQYLSAVFYPFLMPEAWPSYEDEHEEHHHTHIPKILDISTPEKMEQTFPSTIGKNTSLSALMDMTRQNLSQTSDITAQNITSVVNIMSKIKGLEYGAEGEKRRDILLHDLQDQNVMLEAFANPCQSLVTRFEKIDSDGWLDLQLKKENMSKADFANKCDRIIKAYRLSLSNSAKIDEIIRLANEAVLLPEDSFYRQIYLTLARMHMTTRADVKAINGFENQLKSILKPYGMIMSTPVVLDF